MLVMVNDQPDDSQGKQNACRGKRYQPDTFSSRGAPRGEDVRTLYRSHKLFVLVTLLTHSQTELVVTNR